MTVSRPSFIQLKIYGKNEKNKEGKMIQKITLSIPVKDAVEAKKNEIIITKMLNEQKIQYIYSHQVLTNEQVSLLTGDIAKLLLNVNTKKKKKEITIKEPKKRKISNEMQKKDLDLCIKKEPIERAICNTEAFTKYQCAILAEKIIQYLGDFGIEEV